VIITGGAAPKLAPTLNLPFEVVDTLLFEGLLQMEKARAGG
jgi:type III pantothenate kinase